MKILDILPPKGSLGAPHFRSRYEGMPEDYEFHILVTGDLAFDGDKFASATLHVQPQVVPWTWKLKIWRVFGMMFRGIRLARREKVDVIISYDPLTLGIIGAVVKFFTGAKLIVEVNGHIKDAKAARLSGKRVGLIKRKLYNLIGNISLMSSDCVKLLDNEQFEEWYSVIKNKKIVMFHDYVPTSIFLPSNEDDNYLYCLGFPFYLKGVDILLKAFSLIQKDFPTTRLLVMGHCREPERSSWVARAAEIGNVEIHNPVNYEEVAQYIGKCTALVLPSRTEGVARVFLEAMATGKPCIGTNVGGTPNIIKDGVNGFVVPSEDYVALAESMKKLLSDPLMQKHMGEAGRKFIKTNFSDEMYVVNFAKMIDIVSDPNAPTHGLLLNGFEIDPATVNKQ
ncbi:glycosyltransferase [Pseudodesulfovibrio methanolicus]|uniref:Glycosyltransferase n=1 Tax=Pseudodesulfovibrio methanolicus TaxID=3126690 RepID=A0ABZ2J0T1_9BACT